MKSFSDVLVAVAVVVAFAVVSIRAISDSRNNSNTASTVGSRDPRPFYVRHSEFLNWSRNCPSPKDLGWDDGDGTSECCCSITDYGVCWLICYFCCCRVNCVP